MQKQRELRRKNVKKLEPERNKLKKELVQLLKK
jgi:hypothetical protein